MVVSFKSLLFFLLPQFYWKVVKQTICHFAYALLLLDLPIIALDKLRFIRLKTFPLTFSSPGYERGGKSSSALKKIQEGI